MDGMRARGLIGYLMVLVALPVGAQTAAVREDQVEFPQLRQLRVETERDRTLAADPRGTN